MGKHIEKKHFNKLKDRENATKHIIVLNTKAYNTREIKDGFLFTGSVVVSIDYFKAFSASIKNIFGGKINAYDTLLERARREAILRMKENGIKWNADKIINLRLVTSNIGSRSHQRNGIVAVEIMAFGTGIK